MRPPMFGGPIERQANILFQLAGNGSSIDLTPAVNWSFDGSFRAWSLAWISWICFSRSAICLARSGLGWPASWPAPLRAIPANNVDASNARGNEKRFMAHARALSATPAEAGAASCIAVAEMEAPLE